MPDNLGALFLEHAAGMVTERVLRERQIRILQYLAEHKFTISQETFKELDAELDEIENALAEVS